jgi:hypothetical protein
MSGNGLYRHQPSQLMIRRVLKYTIRKFEVVVDKVAKERIDKERNHSKKAQITEQTGRVLAQSRHRGKPNDPP